MRAVSNKQLSTDVQLARMHLLERTSPRRHSLAWQVRCMRRQRRMHAPRAAHRMHARRRVHAKACMCAGGSTWQPDLADDLDDDLPMHAFVARKDAPAAAPVSSAPAPAALVSDADDVDPLGDDVPMHTFADGADGDSHG